MAFCLKKAIDINHIESRITQEGNIADNLQNVRKDGKLIDVTEMAINMLMFGIRVGGGL